MFAGIVRGTGRVVAMTNRGGDRRIEIDCAGVPLGDLVAGASVAVNGVCLTALDDVGTVLRADVSAATLSVTTLGQLMEGDRVNLEPSLRLGEPVDGHLVYGHVDAVGSIRAIAPEARSQRIVFDVPARLQRYVAAKGSIAVDGVSLTVNEVDAGGFAVNVVPHTLGMTIIGGYAAGTTVNIEVDMMARYVERLLVTQGSGITLETLRKHGFAGSN